MKAYNYLILCILPIVQLNTSDQNLTMKSTGLSIKSLPEVQPLPWKREVSLREAARQAVLESNLNPTDPWRSTMSINNLKMQTTLWGPTDRITISLTKNNVWDRRLHDFKSQTLQEITEGAFSPANKYYVGVKEIESSIFCGVDFVELTSLANKLLRKSDPVSVFLGERLNEKTKASLVGFLDEKMNKLEKQQFLLTDLSQNFNEITAGQSISTP